MKRFVTIRTKDSAFFARFPTTTVYSYKQYEYINYISYYY